MASDPEKADSVYDVLYADTFRLSSLLSQFSEDGLVTELTRSVEDGAALTGGMNLRIVKVDATGSDKHAQSQKIDPRWLLPLLFLDRAKDIIQRDIEVASVGSIILATGKLLVVDIGLLQGIYDKPALKRQMMKALTPSRDNADGNRHERRSQKAIKPDTTDQESIVEILSMLPHTPHVNIVTEAFAVWSTIDPANMVGTVSDLTLKHGSMVAGAWSMVGVLDARPLEENADGTFDGMLTPMEMVRVGILSENFWKVANAIAEPARETLGRPTGSYGVTPLIIFREIET